VGCGWLQGEKKGLGGALQARGIGVKEMLTDAINVICLLPQEVGSSPYWPFCSPHISPLCSPWVKKVEETEKLHERGGGGGPAHLGRYGATLLEKDFTQRLK